MVGCHNLVVRALGSGDSVCGFKSRQWHSGVFCWLLLSSYILSFPTACTLYITMPVGSCFREFYDLSLWRNHRKIPTSTICEVNMDIRVLGRGGGKMFHTLKPWI